MEVPTTEIATLILKKELLHFSDLFTIGNVKPCVIYQELGCKPSRLQYYINHPEHLRIKDLRLIAGKLDLHYIVIQRLVERQMDDNQVRLKRFYAGPG